MASAKSLENVPGGGGQAIFDHVREGIVTRKVCRRKEPLVAEDQFNIRQSMPTPGVSTCIEQEEADRQNLAPRRTHVPSITEARKRANYL